MTNIDTLIHSLIGQIDKKSKIVINNFLYFTVFMLLSIYGVLFFYELTEIEIIPFLYLSIIWFIFWQNSEFRGKLFLFIASVFGYIHELIGVHFEYFIYLGGVIGGVPICILPGYGAIFWSSYNLWRTFEENYSNRHWFNQTNFVILIAFLLLILVDYLYFDLSANLLPIIAKFGLAVLLFKSIRGYRLVAFVGFFTVLTEFSGETIGTWYHPEFSFFSLMAGYIFLLWICLTLNDLFKHKKDWGKIEAFAAISLSIFYIFSMLGFVAV